MQIKICETHEGRLDIIAERITEQAPAKGDIIGIDRDDVFLYYEVEQVYRFLYSTRPETVRVLVTPLPLPQDS